MAKQKPREPIWKAAPVSVDGSSVHEAANTPTDEVKQQDYTLKMTAQGKKKKKVHLHFCVSPANGELLQWGNKYGNELKTVCAFSLWASEANFLHPQTLTEKSSIFWSSHPFGNGKKEK